MRDRFCEEPQCTGADAQCLFAIIHQERRAEGDELVVDMAG